jgi:membrane associated rhomboid family serine protease
MFSGIAPASLVILAVNIGLSLVALGNPQLIQRLVFRPYEFARGRNRHTIFTSAFVHADLGHLLFNMVTFYFFGATLLEWLIGTPKFVALYSAGLLLSQLGTYLKQRNNPEYATLGASGAISAVLFASIVYVPTQKISFIFIPIGIPAPLFAIGYLAYTVWSARQNRGRINHDAHFAGALAGLVFVAVTDPAAWARAIHKVFG